jgi:hypothetical protein
LFLSGKDIHAGYRFGKSGMREIALTVDSNEKIQYSVNYGFSLFSATYCLNPDNISSTSRGSFRAKTCETGYLI